VAFYKQYSQFGKFEPTNGLQGTKWQVQQNQIQKEQRKIKVNDDHNT